MGDLPGRVLVLGSINRDLVLKVAAHPRPGETVAASDLQEFPGGKGANQAVAARRSGAGTLLVGATGADGFGISMREFLAGEGIAIGGIRVVSGRPTGIAIITVDAIGENAIAVSPGANFALGASDAEAIDFQPGDHVLAQFEVPEDFIRIGFARAKAAGAVTILNPAPMKLLTPELLALCDILVLNETELEAVIGVSPLSREDEIETAARSLHADGGRTIVVTLGAKGCLALHQGQVLRIAGHKTEAVDTTGAGDCFVGVLAASLAEGRPLVAALERANRAAALSVTRAGAASSMPMRAELD